MWYRFGTIPNVRFSPLLDLHIPCLLYCFSGGMIAPLLGGMLLVIDRSIPVYTSVVGFVISGCCVLLLKDDSTRKRGGMRAIVH